MKQRQQDIEHRDHRGQPSLDEGFHTMIDPLEATDDRDQGERGLHRHAVIPGAFGTQLAVLWLSIFAPKAVIGQHDAAPAELLDERVELLVWDIHRIPIPVDHLAEAIEHPTQLDADAPTPLIFGLFAKLLRAAALTNRKQQFDGKAVNDQEEARVGQEPLVPVLMRDQQALQPGAVGGKTQFLLDMMGVSEYDRITLTLSAKNYVAHARVEGQDDPHGKQWVDLGSTTLFNLSAIINLKFDSCLKSDLTTVSLGSVMLNLDSS